MGAKPRPAGLDATIGRNVRRIREQLGASHDQVAQVLRDGGWSRASGPMLVDIEAGRRGIRVDEALRLASALNVSMEELMDSGDRIVEVGTLSATGRNLARLLTERPFKLRTIAPTPPGRGFDTETWSGLQRTRRLMQVSHLTGSRHSTGDESMREAERHAAERLGITPAEVVQRSYALWHRTLSDERDDRARRKEALDDSKRRRATIRAHITRALLAELAQDADSDPGTDAAAHPPRENE
jgi:transcriptional regulator with XRE-family HTH domain